MEIFILSACSFPLDYTSLATLWQPFRSLTGVSLEVLCGSGSMRDINGTNGYCWGAVGILNGWNYSYTHFQIFPSGTAPKYGFKKCRSYTLVTFSVIP